MNPAFYIDESFNDAPGEVRRERQHGKFSIQPYAETLLGLDQQEKLLIPYDKAFSTVIEKYVIPAECKPDLREALKAGVGMESIYMQIKMQ